MRVEVRHDDVNQARRALKKTMRREGMFRDMKRKEFYGKPSEQRSQRQQADVKRARKRARTRARAEINGILAPYHALVGG